MLGCIEKRHCHNNFDYVINIFILGRMFVRGGNPAGNSSRAIFLNFSNNEFNKGLLLGVLG